MFIPIGKIINDGNGKEEPLNRKIISTPPEFMVLALDAHNFHLKSNKNRVRHINKTAMATMAMWYSVYVCTMNRRGITNSYANVCQL